MRRILPVALILSALAAPAPAWSQQAFPGQHELAAGLACHRNLDMACAQQKLEQALAQFAPEGDPHYLAHVRKARMTLALIHLARDDLARAEREFYTLLLIDPDFQLPTGDHPPKLHYVLSQARERLQEQVQAPEKTKEPEKNPPPEKPKPPTEPEPTPPLAAPTEPAPRIRTHPTRERQALWAGLGAELLFGDDADQVQTGLGASLTWRFWLHPAWGLGIRYAYGRHGLTDDSRDEVLQSMALAAEGAGRISLGPTLLQFSFGVGAQTMGTRDRYDHWYSSLHGCLALVWPARGPWAVALQVQPSLLLNEAEASFFLPVGLAGTWRW